jgi:type II secretory pathway predicted ATPase ExeA
MSRMLLGYYKLEAQPFGVTPDPKFLYLSSTHREAMASLLHGILSGRGFTALIAEPGMGKTTLLFNLLHMLKGIAKTAFLFQTLCGPREFLRALLADLGIEDDDQDLTIMHAKLNEYLLGQSEQGQQVVVIIDEAQNLDEQVLELVRMLSNFETANKKLMHVVLAGQPQLARKLEAENLTQLRQRISIVARLAPFDANDTREYIEHRLKLAGFSSSKSLFTNQAYATIAKYSRGIPRNINNLCFNGMSLACALKRPAVDESMVQETVDDLELQTLVGLTAKAQNKRDNQTGRIPLLQAINGLFSFTKWRRVSVVVSALLFLLRWQAYRAGLFTRKQFIAERIGSALHQNADQAVAKQGTSEELDELQVRVQPDQSLSSISMMYAGRFDKQTMADILRLNPWLKDPKHLQPGQIVTIPLRQRAVRQIQSAPEQSVVSLEFAAQREKR